MNSLQLINWLVTVWERVITLFQTFWAFIVWIVENFFTWVVDLVVVWYENAINWAAYYLNILRDDASTWFEEAKAQALANLITLLEYLIDIINDLRDWVTEKRIELKDWLLGVIDNIKDWLVLRYDAAKAWVNNASDNIDERITNLLGWVIDQKDLILDNIALFQDENRRLLLQALFDNMETLLLFLSNPVTFILDLIKGKLIDLLEDVLADELGTTE